MLLSSMLWARAIRQITYRAQSRATFIEAVPAAEQPVAVPVAVIAQQLTTRGVSLALIQELLLQLLVALRVGLACFSGARPARHSPPSM